MKAVFLSLFIAFAISVSAQQTPEFGEITIEDFKATAYDSFPSVILFNKGIYDSGYPNTLERHIRIKINKKNAMETSGDYKLGNYFETTTKVSAATHYLQEGKVVSEFVEKDAIYKDVKSNREKIVSFPNLKDGCILELKYKSALNFWGMPTWFIQDEVPVLWSEYLLMAPPKLTSVTYGGFEASTYDPKYKGLYHRWIFRDIPAFRTEPLMPALVDYFARIEFWQRQESWTEISRQYLRRYLQWWHEFEPVFSKRKLKLQLDSLVDPVEKIKFITNHVKDNYEWTGYNGYLSTRYSKMFENRKGHSGELNTLLYGILEWAGLKPQFVVLSTHANGLTRKDIISESQFNYVICRVVVKGRQFLLDATDSKLPYDILPTRCYNSEGLIVDEENVQWIKLEPETIERIRANAFFSISPDLMLRGRCTVVNQGRVALAEKKEYEAMGQVDYQRASKPNPAWQADSSTVTLNPKNPLVFSVSHYGVATGNITATGDKIFIQPFILDKEENPFLDDIRDFPVQFDRKIEKTMMFNLSIPTGYKVESLPDSEALSLIDKSITASIKTMNDGKSVVVVFSFNVQKTWFERDEYANLRAFFDRLVAKQNEMIVLVKA